MIVKTIRWYSTFTVLCICTSLAHAQEIPIFEWARQTVRGAGDDYGNAVTTDAAGNVYTTGEFTETADFDPGPSVFNLSPFAAASRDIFISKLDANGNFVWAKSIGGSGLDAGTSILTDPSGNVYVSGYFFDVNVDFDPGPGVFNLSASGQDGFVLKLDTNGNFVWAIKQGTGFTATSIARDASGFIYIVGHTSVAKLDQDGNAIWTKSIGSGGLGATGILSISVDPSGNVLSTGMFDTAGDFDPGAGTFNLTPVGSYDIFISKLDGNGNFVWAKSIGSTGLDRGYGIVTDTNGDALITGNFSGPVDFDPGAPVFNLTGNGGFILKLDAGGNFVWAKKSGGTESRSIAFDPAGNIYSTGYFTGTVDFDPGAGTFNLTSAGNQDIFILKLDASGNFKWATRTGSLSTDIGYAIHADAAGNVYLSSFFYQTADFDPTCNTFNLVTGGSSDVFVQKLSIGNSPTITSFTPTTGSSGISVTITGTNFSTTPANNIVRFFNGVTATVTASTATSITVTVPNGIATGKIAVTVGCVTVQSAVDFVVPSCTDKIFEFTGTATGEEPWSSLISDGTFLYGMTNSGGANDMGVIFKVKTDGTGYVKLLDFAGSANGSFPLGSLISDGSDLYGMTARGGVNNMGIVFKIKTDGTGFAKLLDFAGTTNGSQPQGSLISDGTFLYGMTSAGGTNNMGTIFKLMTDGTAYSKLLDFAGAANGSFPLGSLVYDGTFLYGMSSGGGTGNNGAIFKIKTDGTGFVKLLNFATTTTGREPFGDLVSDGTFLYGMTNRGGAVGDGAIFKIKADGTGFAKIFDFNVNTNGDSPFGSLTYDGVFLYGMTYSGIGSAFGTLFKIKTDGTAHTVLCNFATYAEGAMPYGSLVADGGFLYGMTQMGGSSDGGVIFKYFLGTSLPTITSFTPTSGPVGTTVTITGTNFSATPANNTVQFNGTPAVVTASTSTSITTTVPAGATTGKITVTVGGNTATSATDFTVTTSAPTIIISQQPQPVNSCEGETTSFTLTASGAANLTYQWQKFNGTVFSNISNGGGYTGATTATLSINTSGNFGAGEYRCRVSGDLAADVFSETIDLVVNTYPVATIDANGTQLTASAGDSYQWYQSGNIISQATDQTLEYSVTEFGSYIVEVTENGCTSASDEFIYLITSTETNDESVKIYPNPFTGILHIELPLNEKTEVEIIDALGRSLKKYSHPGNMMLDLSELLNGSYTLMIRSGTKNLHRKLLKIP